MIEMVGKVLPVFLLFGLGIVFRYKKVFTDEHMVGIKRFVINVSLPAVLFQTFMIMELKVEYVTLMALTLALLFLLMLGGFLVNKIPVLYNRFNPYMTTGYAYGLVGLGLFIIMYGEENLAIFSVMGLAHEIFVWVIYFIIFKLNFQKDAVNAKELLKIVKSPIIISIFIGIMFNLLNIDIHLSKGSLWQGFLETVKYLSSTSTPLILVVLGYGMSIKKDLIIPSLRFVIIRVVVTTIIGVLFKIFVIDFFMGKSDLLDVSYISLLLLPPLFTLPILVSEVDVEQEEIINNAVAIVTILSIIVFIIYAMLAFQ